MNTLKPTVVSILNARLWKHSKYLHKQIHSLSPSSKTMTEMVHVLLLSFPMTISTFELTVAVIVKMWACCSKIRKPSSHVSVPVLSNIQERARMFFRASSSGYIKLEYLLSLSLSLWSTILVFQNWMTLVDYVWPPASSEYFLCSLPTFAYVSQDGKLSAIVLMEILL
jgi:hypothetical protein